MLYSGVYGINKERIIRRVVIKRSLHDRSGEKDDLAYWLSRPPGERIEAVEIMRREVHGDLPRMQRVARVIRREKR